MKKTNKILLLVLTIIIALSVVVANHTIYAATDSEGYEEIDINNDDSNDETEEGSANNTATSTNATGNVITINKTNTTNNTANNVANNATNQAKTNYPQTGEFMNIKVIAIVSVATFALVFAFVKVKKYNY